MEQWQPIPGYEEVYEASNLGNIRSNRNKRHYGKQLKAYVNKKGYRVIHLCLDGVEKSHKVNRLIAKTWIPNPNTAPEVNHIDGNKENDAITNLEWCTRSENMIHAYRTGLQQKKLGEDVPWSVLTEELVLAIRSTAATTTMYHKDIAAMYNVNQSTITRVINRKTWKHV